MSMTKIPAQAQPPGSARPATSARLVQFTDTHLMRDPAGSIRGARTMPRLQACLAHARQHYFPVDAILLTGDVVHDEPEAYGAIDLLFGDLGAPVLVIPGNHDIPDEMRRQLGHAPFQVGGQWRTRNGWQLLLLESWFAESADGEGRLGFAQLQEVERALAVARRTGTARRTTIVGCGRTTSPRSRCLLGPRAPGTRSLPRRRRAIHVHARDLHAVQAAQRLRDG
jgi:Icc protein